MRSAAIVLFLSLPLFASTSTTPGRCGASGPLFSVDRRADGHVLLSLHQSGQEYDFWWAPAASVNGTRIEVTERVNFNDMVGQSQCQTATVDLGVLAEGSYDVDWMLDTYIYAMDPGPYRVSYRTGFVQAASSCPEDGLAMVVRPAPPRSSDVVQIDVSQLTRASDYDPPAITRAGSHFTIEQTERVNSIAIIETPGPAVCRTRTFILGALPEGDYDATITQRQEDPAGNRTLSTSVAFHVDRTRARQRGVRH